jgi:formyltetrahydrofolate deformylase
LGDILIRNYSGELNGEIIGVIANHDTLQTLVERFNLPFYLISADGISREEHESRVIEKTKELSPDLLVLAKYMRILSPHFVEQFEGKIVNIHHSFLPAFIGANPYKQAYERGVKIIGATAHFVNNNLDEGPIIAQDIAQVNHTYGWEDMRHTGRNIEKSVLAKALDLVLHDRVFVFNNKTVIF